MPTRGELALSPALGEEAADEDSARTSKPGSELLEVEMREEPELWPSPLSLSRASSAKAAVKLWRSNLTAKADKFFCLCSGKKRIDLKMTCL